MGAHLLAEANARPGVEGEEDERVGGKVLLYPLVEEAVRVESQSYTGRRSARTFKPIELREMYH